MKSYIKTIALLGVMSGVVACTDLDTEITGNYTEFPDNPIAISGEFDGCYHYQRKQAWFSRNYWEAAMLSGDEFVGTNFNGGWYDNGRLFNPSVHKFHPDLQGVGILGDMMSGVSYTNTRIMNYGGEDGKDPMVAPLRAIRAYYTFWMMEFFGDVPILDHTMKEGEVIERAPRADVAKWIESELLEVIPQLTEANDMTTYGRPNKWMAEALLVKLYLNWGVYTHDITTVDNNTPNEKLNDCVKWCDEITASNVFSVGTGYRAKFLPSNGVHIKDFIYAVDMDPEKYCPTADDKYDGGHEFWRFVGFKKNDAAAIFPFPISKSCGGCYIMTPEAVDRFNLIGDERNDIVACGPVYAYDINYNITDNPVYVIGKDKDENGNEVIVYNKHLNFLKEFEWADMSTFNVGADSDLDNLQKGARCWKYLPREVDYTNWERKQTNDIPVFRYADILLSKAECILRGATATNGATVASLVNEVRDCSGAPHVEGAFTLQDLLDERSREFIMEPWRRNDLIRFGKWENCAKWKTQVSPASMSDKNMRLYPIPTGDMNTNKNWKQNPGY